MWSCSLDGRFINHFYRSDLDSSEADMDINTIVLALCAVYVVFSLIYAFLILPANKKREA
ncbi:MAG: hypothetical protein OEZ48_13180 [Candidatus Bathyarchaeota archaeon]|nr:hypothetical protein [Candidatus Bathyarchaeota archaeon]MDH5688799.1 hypothetical protein [Candidatus Bathyarchaeota archaeon]